MTSTPNQVPTLAQCPACGHETLTTEPTGWRAIGPRLTCTAEGCGYFHDITALTPAPAPAAPAHYFPNCRCFACLH